MMAYVTFRTRSCYAEFIFTWRSRNEGISIIVATDGHPLVAHQFIILYRFIAKKASIPDQVSTVFVLDHLHLCNGSIHNLVIPVQSNHGKTYCLVKCIIIVSV